MKFSPQQEEALQKVKRWLNSGSQQVFHMFGYAGTGKTTLAKHIANNASGNVLFAAYTGKAAHVLRSKGCRDAQTIHSLIYHSRDKSKARLIDLEGELDDLKRELRKSTSNEKFIEDHQEVKKLLKEIKKERENSQQPSFILNPDSILKEADLLIIDECSMVDSRMGEDLMSFGRPILVLGDPAQLPPVGGSGFFTENVQPDVMLTDIHRQAEESPIIRMATKVRNGGVLDIGDYGDGCSVLPVGSKMDTDRTLSFDQIIVGKNATRKNVNKRIRYLKGIEDKYPVIGDRIVCLRNNHDLGLLNGAIFEVIDVEGTMDSKVFMSIMPEDSATSITVSAHEHHFLGTEDQLHWFEKSEANEFTYGYALTCHKSQGSQWKNICIMDESYCFRKHQKRWLYTAITRAAETVTIIKT